MIDSIGQTGFAAPVYSPQTVSGGDRVAAEQEQAVQGDEFVPSEARPASEEVYSRKSLLQNFQKAQASDGPDEDAGADAEAVVQADELDEGDKDLIKRLEQRDREVRSHEQAHAAAAGEYAKGPPVYTYQMGPDGRMYAIGGSLAVDVGKEADPAENRVKASMLRASALGVDGPSAADASVALQAAELENASVDSAKTE